MKFLNCLHCHDIIMMYLGGIRVCLCGRSQGAYIDKRQAEYSGPSRVLGMLGEEYMASLTTDGTEKIDYKWFVIPEGHNIRKVESITPPAPPKNLREILDEAGEILKRKKKKPKG